MSRVRTKEFYLRMNSIMDKLALTNLSPNENKYCWALFRKTLAFGEYLDYISRDLMAKLTGMDPTTVSHVKNRLKNRNIIYQSGNNTGFYLQTGKWVKVKVSSLFQKVKVSSPKGEGRTEKKGEGIVTLQRTTKNLPKKKKFSTSPGKKKKRKVPEGLKKFIKDLRKLPGKKK